MNNGNGNGNGNLGFNGSHSLSQTGLYGHNGEAGNANVTQQFGPNHQVGQVLPNELLENHINIPEDLIQSVHGQFYQIVSQAYLRGYQDAQMAMEGGKKRRSTKKKTSRKRSTSRK